MDEFQIITKAVPILFITTLVQFLKQVFNLPSRYAQLAVFFFALIFATLFYWNADITTGLIAVLTYSLGAVGLWEVGGKPLIQSQESDPDSENQTS